MKHLLHQNKKKQKQSFQLLVFSTDFSLTRKITTNWLKVPSSFLFNCNMTFFKYTFIENIYENKAFKSLSLNGKSVSLR